MYCRHIYWDVCPPLLTYYILPNGVDKHLPW